MEQEQKTLFQIIREIREERMAEDEMKEMNKKRIFKNGEWREIKIIEPDRGNDSCR